MTRAALGSEPPTDLVLVAHGTRDAAGAATTRAVRDAVAQRLPGVDVRLAFVDVQNPTVRDVVGARARAGRRVAVVPLLLSIGYHLEVDVTAAVAPHPRVASSAALGPHPLLTQALVDRLTEAGATSGDDLVLAAAGSSRAAGATDARAAARMLGDVWGRPVQVGFGASAQPSVPDAVAAARAAGARRVVVSSYLVGEGFFASRLHESGADIVAAPMAAHPALVDLAVHRYADMCARLDECERAVG